MNAARITLKLLEFISCIAAVIIKKLSDSHAERIYRINEKFSREWRLLNSLTWSQEGNDFSIFLYIGFAFITGVFMVSSWFDQMMRLSEKLMCTFGAIFYILEGCLVFASLEYIPADLSLYAYILGSVSLLTAALLIIDLCAFGGTENTAEKSSQTETYSTSRVFGKATCSLRPPFRMSSINDVFTPEDGSKKHYFLNIDKKSPLKPTSKALEKYLMTAV